MQDSSSKCSLGATCPPNQPRKVGGRVPHVLALKTGQEPAVKALNWSLAVNKVKNRQSKDSLRSNHLQAFQRAPPVPAGQPSRAPGSRVAPWLATWRPVAGLRCSSRAECARRLGLPRGGLWLAPPPVSRWGAREHVALSPLPPRVALRGVPARTPYEKGLLTSAMTSAVPIFLYFQ